MFKDWNELQESNKIVFFGNEIVYTNNTLTPRLETENLITGILPILDTVDTVIDVGTWSGCIILGIARRAPHLQCYATELSSLAFSVAQYNIWNYNFPIKLMYGSLALPVLKSLLLWSRILIVANLPYIPSGIKLPSDVINQDPALALFWGGVDGLNIVRTLIEELRIYKNTFYITLALELFEWQVTSIQSEYLSMIDNFRSWNDVCWVKRFCSFTFLHETS